MKYSLLSFTLLFPLVFLAQNIQKLAYTHSPNGEIIYNEYDTFLNDEYGGLNFSFEDNAAKYEKGNYKLKEEKFSVPALIRLQSEDKIKVKNGIFENSSKIDLDKFEYYTTKIDSFFTSNKIQLLDKEITKPIVLQYIGETENADYAMYYKFNNGIAAKKKILVLNKAEGNWWKELDLNIQNPKKIFSLLGFRNKLNKFYDKQERTIEDFLNTLKAEEYREHYENNTMILYDKLWREIKNQQEASYFGRITKIEDDIYSVQISNNTGEKLFDLNYSSLHPLKKHGDLIAYEGDAIKMVRTYDNGDLLSSKRFMDDELLLEFDYLKFETGEDKPQKFSRRVVSIGQNTIDSYANIDLNIDHLGKSIAYNINKKDIISSLKQTSSGNIHLYSNYTEPIDLTNFEYQLRTFLENERSFTNTMVSNDFENTMVIEIITDYKGKALSYKILRTNNESLTNLITSFGEKFLSKSGNNKMRFKEIKLEDKKAQCTFVLPINFEHKQFYKTFSRPNYDYYNWNWMFQQQMIWQQQQLMNQQIINSLPRF